MADETVPCPGCAVPMGLDQEVCEACRRPRDELEIQRGRDQIAERAEKRRRLPRTIAYRVLAIAALALAYRFRGLFFDQVSGLRDEVHKEMKEVESPAVSPGTAEPKPTARAVVTALLGGPVPAPASPPIASPSPPAPPAPPSAPTAAAPPATPVRKAVFPKEPREAPQTGWRSLYGVVFDMKTLQPIPQAVIKVTQGAHGPIAFQTRTDEEGHYQVDFLPGAEDPGFAISVTAPGYRDGQIEDPEPSYLQRTQEDRLASIAEVAPADLDPVPLRFRDSDIFIPRHLVLVPEDATPSK